MSDDNIIELASRQREQGPTRKVLRRNGCSHLRVEIDQDGGTVECLDCKRIVDPFVVLLGYVNEETFVFQNMVYWREETSELQAKADELRREIRNLQAQKRRLTKKVVGHLPLT
jgi:predicted transcriptional regulator